MEKWSEQRLDDLNRGVESGFDRVDADLRGIRGEMGALGTGLRDEMGTLRTELRGEMGALRAELRGEMGALGTELRSEMNARFERVDARFDALQRTMLQLSGVVVAALVGVIATLIATQL